MHYVYILQMNNGSLYAGYTTDLKRRLQEHKGGAVRTTSRCLPVILLFYEAYVSKQDAVRREAYFKTSKGKTTLRLMLRDSLSGTHDSP